MLRLLPLALVLLTGCSTSDLGGRLTRAAAERVAGGAIERAVERAVQRHASRAAGSGDGPALAAAEFGTHSRLPDRMVPAARLDTADVAAWAARELGVELRRAGTSPAGADGGALLRFEQARDGVPVVGAFLVAEARPGADTVATLAGTLYDDLDGVPRRPRRDAAAAVRAAGGAGEAALVILARTHPFAGDDHTLAWRVRTDRGLDSRDVYVDALTGQRLGTLPLVVTLAEPARAAARDTVPAQLTVPTVLEGRREVEGAEVAGAGDERFRLHSLRWGGRLGSLFDGEGRVVASPQAASWPDIGWRNGAYDAFWGLDRTHAHLAGAHGWHGLRGRGATPYRAYFGDVSVSEEPYPNAAWWASRNVFIFGWATPDEPFSALNVVGHEVGHAVDTHSAGLVPFGESGALNESIADVRGIAVHRSVHGGTNGWRLGPPFRVLRRMDDPNASETPQPDTRRGDHWLDVPACRALPDEDRTDRCGVHLNAGVGNRWFTLLVDGGEGENDHRDVYDVDGIGFELAERIVHRAHTRYLGPTSDYADYRRATVRAAADLTGERAGSCDTPTLDAVQGAWYAVGVGPPPCRCFEGSFTLSFSDGADRVEPRVFARGDVLAVEVETDIGTVYSRSRVGDDTITLRGAVTYRGTPTDLLYDAGGLPRREVRVELPRRPLPRYDVLDDAWDEARTGRTRRLGPYTAVEYDWRRVSAALGRAGLPAPEGAPSGTVWTVRDMCLAFIDVTAGLTQITYGSYERASSWLGFLGLPVEFSTREGAVRITDLREHPVSDAIVGE